MSVQGGLVKHILYPLNELRERKKTLSFLRGLEESQYATLDELHDIRWAKLKAVLHQAYHYTPFYRERFRASGITPRDIRDWSDLRKIPRLTKADLQAHLSDMIATNIPAANLHRRATGGSSGHHTPFFRDNRSLEPKMAVQLRFNRWAGWDVGEPLAFVWVALQDFSEKPNARSRLRNWLIDRHLALCAGKLDEAVLADYAGKLRRFRPALIRAFPNLLAVVADYLQKTPGVPVQPQGIITVGEPLLEKHRSLFEEVFGCPVFNCYVSRECGNMACECEAHSGLHIAAESLHLDFERDGKPVGPGQVGEIIVTDLENQGMPLIRYQINDMGSPLSGSCSCGRTLPRIAMEAGRISDFVVSPTDGALVSGVTLCHYLLAEGPNVGQIQLIQDARDHLTIRIARGSHFEESNLDHFRAVIGRIFQGGMKTDYVFVDSIPKEPSGKFRFCVNQIAG
jgi:phenylacetate-CoA ligase